MEDEIARMLIESGCYINTHHNKDEVIKLPDGNIVLAYLSCRLAISDVKIREKIEKELTNKVKKEFEEDITVAGMATAGISWAHSIAQRLQLPMLYIRSSEKSYGLKGLIEGNIKYATNKVVAVDDILNTGSTIYKAKEELKKHNMDLVGVACIATLKDRTISDLEKENVKVIRLTDYRNIINMALKFNVLNDIEYDIMKKFYEEKRG